MLALGQRGKAWFEEQIETIDETKTTVDGLDITLKEALTTAHSHPDQPHRLPELDEDITVRLTGTTVSCRRR